MFPQAGRSSKRQLFLFPGGIERHVKIKTCSVSVQLLSAALLQEVSAAGCHSLVCCAFQVALEVIEELCYEMGLHRPESMEEYAIFLVTSRGALTDVCFFIVCTQHALNNVLMHAVSLLYVVSEAAPCTEHIYQAALSLLAVGKKSLIELS